MSNRATRIECQYAPLNGGPFGRYTRYNAGHVMNALSAYGIPLHLVERVQFSRDDRLTLDGKHFATYAYFEGIEQPIFGFSDCTYLDAGDNGQQADFRLNLFAHQKQHPCLLIAKEQVSDEFRAYLTDKIFHSTYALRDDTAFELAHSCGAKFKWGFRRHIREFVCIEFWYPEHAQAFVQYLNTQWRPTLQAPVLEYWD